jgi:hypothetical protein
MDIDEQIALEIKKIRDKAKEQEREVKRKVKEREQKLFKKNIPLYFEKKMRGIKSKNIKDYEVIKREKLESLSNDIKVLKSLVEQIKNKKINGLKTIEILEDIIVKNDDILIKDSDKIDDEKLVVNE